MPKTPAATEFLAVMKSEFARVKEAWALASATLDGPRAAWCCEAYKGLCDTAAMVGFTPADFTA